nr:4Fe-4S dicluster domain-containing protein [Bacilli bacterium]
IEQMRDNISFMGATFKPIDEKERKALDKVVEVFKSQDVIACTACRYCVDGCPKQIPIPDLFACLNGKTAKRHWDYGPAYNNFVKDRGKASDCIKCGRCEHVCPQNLPIRQLLEKVAKEFE